MTVMPPSTWGKISGTVVGVRCDGSIVPLAGATVQIDTWAAHYTLKTDANGGDRVWGGPRHNPPPGGGGREGAAPPRPPGQEKEGGRPPHRPPPPATPPP